PRGAQGSVGETLRGSSAVPASFVAAIAALGRVGTTGAIRSLVCEEGQRSGSSTPASGRTGTTRQCSQSHQGCRGLYRADCSERHRFDERRTCPTSPRVQRRLVFSVASCSASPRVQRRFVFSVAFRSASLFV